MSPVIMSLLVWLFEAFQVISEKKIHKILIIAPTFQNMKQKIFELEAPPLSKKLSEDSYIPVSPLKWKVM